MIDVAVIMGSITDYDVMKEVCDTLDLFNISYEKKVVSAHRTPEYMVSYAKSASEKGIKLIIAGAGGAAHLPGMVASLTHLPVIGVPIKSKTLNGIDSLLSIVQMPKGVPVGTMSINGARNAALYAVSILSINDSNLRDKYIEYRNNQTKEVKDIEI